MCSACLLTVNTYTKMNVLQYMLLFLFVIVHLSLHVVHSEGLIEVFQWKQMDFHNRGDGRAGNDNAINQNFGNIVFPDQLPQRGSYSGRRRRNTQVLTSRDDPKDIASRFSAPANSNASASYIPYNNVPMGVTHFNGRLFITMPRRRVGIPSTLNYIDLSRDGRNPSPKLHAYPNFETNQLNEDLVGNPNHIVSVYRTSVDACNRLWFIDTGMLEYPNNRMQIQRPALWVMDLKNRDTLVRKFEIPEATVATGRGLASVTVDVTANNCNQAFAYIPDLVENRLYVYSFEKNRIWSFSHNYFNFDPLAGDLSVGGQTFRWDDGIFSITLGPLKPNGYRSAMFHPMASNNEFIVSTEVLQNEANAARSDHGTDFQLLGNRGTNRQSTMHDYDPRTGTVFYAEIQRNAVSCWNTKTPFTSENHGTVASDAQRMIYPSDLTVDNEGTVWLMTNSMPIFIYSNLDPNVVNFRVWNQRTEKAIQNTVCA